MTDREWVVEYAQSEVWWGSNKSLVVDKIKDSLKYYSELLNEGENRHSFRNPGLILLRNQVAGIQMLFKTLKSASYLEWVPSWSQRKIPIEGAEFMPLTNYFQNLLYECIPMPIALITLERATELLVDFRPLVLKDTHANGAMRIRNVNTNEEISGELIIVA